MSKKYYTLPLRAVDLIKKGEHKTCNLNESIAHQIHLINTTYFGECTFDDDFGSMVWELDFDNHKNVVKLKEMVMNSLYDTLRRYEKRLSGLNIQVKIKQQEFNINEYSSRIKKRVDISIKGKIRKTDEDFHYKEHFYIGPLSY